MIITAPRDPKRLGQLRAKLAEYEGRLQPFQAPELNMDTIYKKELLACLLGEGSVNTERVQENLRRLYYRFGSGIFENAVRVIEDYVLTGGANVPGGTGLPEA